MCGLLALERRSDWKIWCPIALEYYQYTHFVKDLQYWKSVLFCLTQCFPILIDQEDFFFSSLTETQLINILRALQFYGLWIYA